MGELFESLCIRVPKVYDWVRRQVVLPQIFTHDTSLFNEHVLKGLGDDVEVEIILTDCHGTPVDPSDEDALDKVIELVPHGGRRPRTIILPDGESVVLHEVKLSISGFYKIKLIDLGNHQKHHEFTSCNIPWKTHQTFYLCAPEGTEPVVHLDSFEGTGGSIRLSHGSLQLLSFDIVLCLSVQIEKDVKIEVEGSFCYPRPEIIDPSNVGCLPVEYPPQCEAIFPGKHHHDECDERTYESSFETDFD
ncbi:BMQ_0737 family morphogenetic spore coat protein [Priestia megaterium]